RFRYEVTAATQVQKPFAFQYLSIAKDLFCTHRQPKEQRNHYTHEKVHGNVCVVIKAVLRTAVQHVVVLHHIGDEKCQYGRLKKVDVEILLIRQFRQHVPFGENLELLEPVRNFLNDGQLLCDVADLRYLDILLKVLVPLPGRNLSRIGQPTVFIHHLGLNDTEDLLRIDIPALRTGTLRFVCGVDHLPEVSDCLDRVAVINLESTGVHDDQCVEHLKDVGRRLVDYHEDHFPPPGQFLQEVHDIFRVAGRKPRSRLIDEKHRRLS